MLFNRMTFIGIDPTAGKRPNTYIAIDKDLHILALGEGGIEEITAFVGGQESAFVSICAPQRPNQGLMKREDIRASLSPNPRPGRWLGFRVVEYLLYQRNIRTPRTSSSEMNCPRWMQMGFKIFRRLKRLGYQNFPQDEIPKQLIETYPHASYTAMLERLPFRKNTLEGRLQRQMVLYNHEIEVSDPIRVLEEITHYRLLQGNLPLEGLHTPNELDALVAAYTSWQAALHPDQITILGYPEEGQIVIPVGKLKAKY